MSAAEQKCRTWMLYRAVCCVELPQNFWQNMISIIPTEMTFVVVVVTLVSCMFLATAKSLCRTAYTHLLSFCAHKLRSLRDLGSFAVDNIIMSLLLYTNGLLPCSFANTLLTSFHKYRYYRWFTKSLARKMAFSLAAAVLTLARCACIRIAGKVNGKKLNFNFSLSIHWIEMLCVCVSFR